jgi:hypothetical protein
VPQNLGDHLEFALKHEGINLLVLKFLFRKTPKSAIEAWISKTPGGANTRRVWFIYEWLIEEKLDVPPVPKYEPFDMPNRTLDLLHRFLCQNKGTLSQRARRNEFAQLTQQEVAVIERMHTGAFATIVGLPDDESVPTSEPHD